MRTNADAKKVEGMTEEQVAKLVREAQWVIAMFDQANAGDAVTKLLGSRGELLKQSVEDVRRLLIGVGIDPYPPPGEGQWVTGGTLPKENP